MTEFVTIHEVGPRDGLQNEAGSISVADKVGLINALRDAGLKRIEMGSFVSAERVPQMADTDRVTTELSEIKGGQYDVLVPNMRGWERFCAASKHGDYGVSLFVSATEGFSQSNLNCSIDQSFERIKPVAVAAQAAGVPLRGYISCVTDCPFEGEVDPDAVLAVALKLRDLAPMPLSLGDTLGTGTPERVEKMLAKVLTEFSAGELAGHYHNTGGRAIDNIEVSLSLGLRAFDAAAGGLGGCPYAPGATGNVATEAVVAHLHANGFATGVDPERLRHATVLAENIKRTTSEFPAT